MQTHVNLVDLVKSFPTNILLQNLASIQQRTSLIRFDHFDEKSEEGSISNLSTKVDSIEAKITESTAKISQANDTLFTETKTAAEAAKVLTFES